MFEPEDNDHAVAPLDMPSIGGVPPGKPAPPPKAKRPSWKELAPLAAMMPLIAKNGGRMGIAAFLQAVQQAKERKANEGRQGYLDQRQIALDQQQAQRYQADQAYRQQQQTDQRATQRATQERQREADRRALVKEFTEAVNRVDTPEAASALLELYGQRATALGMTRSDVEQYAMETNPPTVLQQRVARSRLEDARRQYGADAPNMVYQLPGEPAPVSYEELEKRAGYQRRADAPPRGQAAQGTLTEFEAFFHNEYLPAVLDERAAAGNSEQPTRKELADLKIEARQKWTGAGRAPTRTTARPPSVAATRQTESRLDEQVAYILRNPQEGTRATWREIARAYEGLGVTFSARREAIARRLEREDRQAATADPSLDVMSPAARIAEAERIAGAEAGGRGRGAGPGAPVPPPAPGAPRTATRAQVEAVAAQRRVTYAEAKRQLEARGVRVTD